MIWVWVAVGIAIAGVAVDWAYREFASSRIQNLIDNVPPFSVSSPEPADEAQLLSIPTTDGLKLEASLHSSLNEPKGLIVFCPELHGSHWTVAGYCPALIRAGFAVLAFNVRNQGESEYEENFEPIHWGTESELSDLESVLKFIQAHETFSSLPLGVFGISRGGALALVAACRFSQIESVVTDSAYDTMSLVQHFISRFSRYVVPDWFFNRLPGWHVDWVLRQALRKSERKRGCTYLRLASEAHRLTQPVLLISGQRDSYVTPALAEQLASLLGREDCLWIVSRAKHNRSRSVAQDEYDKRLVRHFEKTLLSTGQSSTDAESRVA